ncbi:MAG: amidohydrolase family protein [Alphaproteobacteria bacterium]|nr:amidohydrolase family protein [Alphaproteobacteria bacterium]
MQDADILLLNGTVYDGTLSEPRVADVAILDDRIVFVGDATEAGYTAPVSLDVTGKYVAPGFVDPHTHYDRDITPWANDPDKSLILPAIMQGVTTVFVGVDGSGHPAIAETLSNAEKKGIGPNVAAYVGFGAVRSMVLGYSDKAPDAEELDTMKGLVRKGMCEGAFGFSTGLFYSPQSYSKTDEVIALTKEAAKRGGLYDSHIRDESSYTVGLLGAVQEVIDIGEATGIPLHIAHLKALGVDVHGMSTDVIDLVESAQTAGLTVTADQYPWVASGTSVSASLLPRWAQVGGEEAMVARLRDPEDGPKIREAMKENMRRRGGPDSLLISNRTKDEWIGKTLQDLSEEWDVDPIEAAIRVLEQGGAGFASFNQSEEDVKRFMQQPWVMTSSDASDGHPRKYASYTTKYTKYVKKEKTLTTTEFVNSSTGRAADALGLVDRGYLKEGYYADIVVFDPEEYAPRATFVKPEVLSVGVVDVLVNGEFAVRDGEPTNLAPGRGLKHVPEQGTCE